MTGVQHPVHEASVGTHVRHLLLVPLLLVTSLSTTAAESTRPVLTRQDWNELCMANALEEHGVYTRHGNHWASSVDKGIHQSFCTCRHEKVKGQTTMTLAVFVEAATQCREEFAEDFMKSAAKYLQIHLDERDQVGP